MCEMFVDEHFSEHEGSRIMALNKRQAAILTHLKTHGRASVKALAVQFFVSEMTVRRDLGQMESLGYVQRYTGGAVYQQEESAMPIAFRRLLHADEKAQLSRHAEKYLHDGLTVFLDSSSTCTHLVPLLAAYKNIQILTNSIPCLLAAAKHHIPCTVAGGEYLEKDMCTYGSAAERFLEQYNTDVAFFSASALSDDGLITDRDAAQTAVRRVVLQRSAQNIFLFDSTKLHKKFLHTVCRAEEVDEIILL